MEQRRNSKQEIRRRNIRRSSRQSCTVFASSDTITSNRSTNFLIMLLFYGFCQQFQKNRKKIIFKKQEESRQRIKANIRNSTNTIMTIEPIHKEIINLNQIKPLLFKIGQCSKALLTKKENEGEPERQNQRQILSSKFALKKSETEAICKNINSEHIQKENIKPFHLQSTVIKQTPFPIRKKQHVRAYSDTLQSKPQQMKINKKSWITQSYPLQSSITSYVKPSSPGHHNNHCRQKRSYLKDIFNGVNFNEYNINAIRSILEIFLQNIHKSNYMLNIFCSDYKQQKIDNIHIGSHKDKEIQPLLLKMNSTHSSTIFSRNKITIYTDQLQEKFTKMMEVLQKIMKNELKISFANNSAATTSKSAAKNCFQIKTNPLYTEYLELSNKVIDGIRVLLTSIYFQKTLENHKLTIKILINLIYDTRFTLKYLEKQIDNLNYGKKTSVFIPKWQKAYCAKFLPKQLFA